jgi:hypothetical protein
MHGSRRGGFVLKSELAWYFMTVIYERFGLPYGLTKDGRAVSMRCRRLVLDEAVCGDKRQDMGEEEVSSEPDRRLDCRDTVSQVYFGHLEY